MRAAGAVLRNRDQIGTRGARHAHGRRTYYNLSKESPAWGLCGGLCGRVVREVVRGTLGGCAGRLGLFLVGCALRLVHICFCMFLRTLLPKQPPTASHPP